MKKTMLGIDIGDSGVKLALVSGNKIQKLIHAPLPDGLVKEHRILSVDALAEELKRILKQEGIRARSCALVLPPETAFVRRIRMPYMTTDHLKINLPYEFHDYIQLDKGQYFYDYAVVGVYNDEEGNPEELELIAATTEIETIHQYRKVLRKAGLKLQVALPEYLTYRNMIRSYEKNTEEHPEEYCIVDMGHDSIRVHMYHGDVYDTTRVIEYGGDSLDKLIANEMSVDTHTAGVYKMTNYNDVLEIRECRNLFSHIATEIMRAVKFYQYNTPEAKLQDIYLSGGLSCIEALAAEIQGTVELECHFIEALLPQDTDPQLAAVCASALGITMQGKGR